MIRRKHLTGKIYHTTKRRVWFEPVSAPDWAQIGHKKHGKRETTILRQLASQIHRTGRATLHSPKHFCEQSASHRLRGNPTGQNTSEPVGTTGTCQTANRRPQRCAMVPTVASQPQATATGFITHHVPNGSENPNSGLSPVPQAQDQQTIQRPRTHVVAGYGGTHPRNRQPKQQGL